jgi:uncharacterized membrane protein YqiK
VTYYVNDIVAALSKVADLPSDIMERSQGALLASVSEHTMEEIQADRLGFSKKVTDRIGSVLNGYGVQVLQAQVTEFAPCRAFAITGHAAIGQYALWTGF